MLIFFRQKEIETLKDFFRQPGAALNLGIFRTFVFAALVLESLHPSNQYLSFITVDTKLRTE